MTHKDYGLIAGAIKEAKPAEEFYSDDPALRLGHDFEQVRWARTTRSVADALASENPRFDRERFLRACGVKTDGHSDERNAREHVTIRVTTRELWNLICAQNALAVGLERGQDWSAYLVGAHMRADGVQPLTLAESDRLIKRLEAKL